MHSTQARPARAAPRVDVFSALRHPQYRLYWAGSLVSVVGMTMEWVAVSWLVFEVTNSAISLGLTGIAQTLPRVVFSLIGGAIADRADRRILVVGCHAVCGVLYLILGGLTTAGWVQVWHVMVVASALGIIRAFEGPGRQALLPHVVSRDDIPNAVALGNVAWEGPRLVGPALAGILIATVGIGPTLYVAAGGFVVSMTLFALLRIGNVVQSGGSRNLLQNVVEGFRFILGNQLFGAIIGLTFFNSVFGMAYQILLPVFARDILEVGPSGLGFLVAASGAGSLMGSLIAAALATYGGRSWQIFGGATVFGFVLMAFAYSPSFVLSLVLLFVAGLSCILYMNAMSTVLQLRLSDDFRARVLGVWGLVWSLMPLGGTLGGVVAQVADARLAVAAGGLLVICATVWVFATMPQFRRLDEQGPWLATA